MKYKISLNPVPQWVRYDLAKMLKEKIEQEKLDATIPDFDANNIIHRDLPFDIVVEGTKDTLIVLIPFIYDWLTKKRVIVEYDTEYGLKSIKISGYDPEHVVRIVKMLEEEKNDSYTEYNYG
jgi:hypothetical protein